MNEVPDQAREGREYPKAPIVGVSAVVICGDQILLVKRGREPMLGAWSLPGGALELGETTADGAAREVFEETGIRARPVEVITSIDRILRDQDGRVQFHYVLVEWLCLAEESCEPVCGDDAAEARWVPRDEIFYSAYELGESTLGVIERALKMAEAIAR